VAVGAGAIWVTNFGDGTVSRIDPQTNRVVATIPVGRGPTGVAVGEGAVWVANTADKTVSRIDPERNEVNGSPVDLTHWCCWPGRFVPNLLAVGESAVWVTTTIGFVLRIDPRTFAIERILPRTQRRGAAPNTFGIAVGRTMLWTTSPSDNIVSRIDPRARKIIGRPLFIGGKPRFVEVSAGAVWITSETDGAIVRLEE